jgi:hypothetical protein
LAWHVIQAAGLDLLPNPLGAVAAPVQDGDGIVLPTRRRQIERAMPAPACDYRSSLVPMIRS